jgi:Calcineurin-like phosphoesterase
MPQIVFQIMSDLRLETPLARLSYDDFAERLELRSSHLALLGDIGYACDPRLFNFLEDQLHRFQTVFFLLGNHEAYGMSFSPAKTAVDAFAARVNEMRRLSEPIGRFVFLDQTRYDFNEHITILGCTLFSHISEEQTETVNMFVTDFSRIEDWEFMDHNKAHKSDVNWLNAQVKSITEEEPERTVVVFTHHSPTLLEAATDPMHKDDSAQVNSAFATDLSREICWRSSRVKLWAFGHTHVNCDFEDPHSKKRVFANQKGYCRAENFNFECDQDCWHRYV